MNRVWGFFAIVLLAGCVQPADQALPRIHLDLSKNTIADPMDGVSIRAVMENTASRDFVYWHASCQEPRVHVEGLGIRDGKAPLFGPDGPQGCAAAIIEATLRPGERLEATYVWNGTADPADPNSPRAAAREYVIVATLSWVGPRGWNTTSERSVWILG